MENVHSSKIPENKIPIIVPNGENIKFGGSSLIVELIEEEKRVEIRITEVKGEYHKLTRITFSDYEEIRKQRVEDRNNFQ